VEDLEMHITLEELTLLLDAAREREHRQNRFMAALKGIDIDKDNDIQDRFNEVQRRAEARLTGKSAETLEWDEFGIDVDDE
jgi:hypothetical protein